MNAIDAVRDFAAKAHEGQTSKHNGEPYIEHSNRVAEIVKGYNQRLPVLAAALLHDVVEKTSVSDTALSVFLHNVMEPDEAAETLRLVIQLTDAFPKSNYPYWNRKERKDREHSRLAKITSEAQTIKYADIIDNTNQLIANNPDAASETLQEYMAVLEKADKGNTVLYKQALEIVTNGLYAVKKEE